MANIPFLNNAYFAGKVGIGNSSPTKELEIGTNAAAETEFRMHSDVSGKYFNIQSAGNFTSVKTAGSQNFILDSSGSAGYITMVTNASERIRVNYNGNVGIGTTNPTQKLHVDGNTLISAEKYYYTAGTGGGFGSDASGNFKIRQNDADLIFGSGNNVGIGTASPSTKLHVNGDIRQQGSSYSVNITGGGSITGDNHLDIAANGSYLNLRSPNNSIFYRASSDHAFRDAGGSNEYLRIKTSGTNAGNVGIGTTSPTSTLHVVGTQVYKGYVKFENTVHAIRLDLKSSSHTANIYMDGTGGVISGGGLLFNTPTARTHFMESGTPKMSIISGNVGIGTTSPSARLEVAASATTSVDIAHFSNSNGSAKIKHTLDVVGSGMISILDSVNNEDVRLSAQGNSWLNAGNVGIGTTSPQTKLQIAYTDTHTSGDLSISNSAFDIYNTSSADVAGKGSTLTFSDNYSGTTKTTRAAIKGGTDTAGNTADGFLAFYTDKSGANSMQQRMIINHDGRVSFNDYGSGSFTGTATQRLAVDTNGNVIEIPIGSGPVDGSGTANYSARWIDTDTLGIGTLYDNGTNVGIGTTSPSTKLDIRKTQGTGVINDTNSTLRLVDISTGLNAGQGAVISLAGVYSSLGFILGGAPYIRAAKANANDGDYGFGLQFGVRENGSATPTAEMVINSNGNVGIGTTSPSRKLHVHADSGNAYLQLTQAATGTTSNDGFQISMGVSQVNFINRENGNMVFETNNTEKMRITNTGNIGIGNSIPVNKQQNKYTSVAINSMTATAGTASTNWNRNAGLLIEESNSSNGLALGVSQTANDRKSWIQSGHPGSSANNLGVLSLNPLGGNVGIGTTSPSQKLDVRDGTITSRDSGNVNYAELDRFAGLTLKGNGVGAKYISTPNTDALGFKTNSAERMRITSTGSVGIGTTSPIGMLSVVNPVSNSNTWTPTNNPDLWVSNAGTSNSYYAFGVTTNSGDIFSITNAGYVGIGTTAPSQKLSVDGNILISDTDNNKYFGSLVNLILNADADGNSGDTARNIIFQNRGSEKMRLDAFGRLGIGTTSPGGNLHVVGNAGSSGQIYLSDRDNGTGTGDALLINKSGTNAFIYNRDGGQLSFGTNNVSNNLVIANTGNVGIGTTSPVYKLDANGAVRAGGVITYSKPYSNLTTTGQAVAGLTSSSNGNSTGFTFTCFGDTGGYQKIVYSCYNDMGTWRTKKVINEGTNNFDVEASADGSTITFTFKSTSGTKYYTPRVTIEATGHSINSTYA